MTFALAFLFFAGMFWGEIESRYIAPLAVAMQADPDSTVLILSRAASQTAVEVSAEPVPEAKLDIPVDRPETCDLASLNVLARLDLPPERVDPLSQSADPRNPSNIFEAIRKGSSGLAISGGELISFAHDKLLPNFGPAYRSVVKLAAFIGLPRIQSEAALNNAMIMGTVSTYNPFRDGIEEGGAQTASGEFYDPTAWTAAVQSDLREQFGGVRYGKLYQPKFALVDSGEKRVIVRINDVGRLKPGRVLDLNERSMRYFDPFLSRGLIENVRVTLLPGEDWTAGPVGDVQLISLAAD